MNGKYRSNPAPCLQHQDRLEINQERVSNIMAEHYYTVSSDISYNHQFLAIKQTEERIQLKGNKRYTRL